MNGTRWYFRAFETAEGWACRHGAHIYDLHPTLEEALHHLTELATRPAQLVVHHLDGTVTFATLLD
jgi:hypothetical protein